jgi:predicted amidophosphoribosyltransferase
MLTKINLTHQGAPPTYVLGVRITDDKDDPWTQRFNCFKKGDSYHVDRACRAMAKAVQSMNEFHGEPFVTVGAIPSRSTSLPDKHPVATLGRHVSQAMGWKWCPHLLNKKAHKSLHTITGESAQQRRYDEVHEAYRAQSRNGPPGAFVIFDDMATTGATLADIQRALLAANPYWTVRAVPLCKTTRLDFMVQSGLANVNAQLDSILADLWPCS